MGIGGGGAIAATQPSIRKSVREKVESFTDDSYPTTKEFRFSDNFVEAQWSVGPKLSVTTSAKGEMDGFGIFHEYADSYEDALELYEAPKNGGELFIDFKNLLDNNEPPFPTRMFELWAYKGEFGSVNIIQEKVDSVKLGAPRSYVMPEYFKSEQ